HRFLPLPFAAPGLLFWGPIVGVDPTRWRLHPAARLGYLFLMLPFHAFLGVALMSSHGLLAPPMAPLPPARQPAGGGILWAAGDLVSVIAALGIMLAWADQDQKEAARIDRRLERERAAGPLRPVRPGGRRGGRRPGQPGGPQRPGVPGDPG